MNKMERKFGRYAIPNLMYYIVILYAVGVLVQMMAPAFYIQYLMLDARAILHGQIWRVVTFMIWPPSGSLFFNLIAIYLYYNLGMTLERVWGTFRFNVYFFMGVIGHVLAALLIYIITGQVYILTTDYLNFSLFFTVKSAGPFETALSGIFIYSFTPPIVRPVTKYLCKKGYRHTIGSIVAMVAAARTETGVTAPAAAVWEAFAALPLCCITEDSSFISSY